MLTLLKHNCPKLRRLSINHYRYKELSIASSDDFGDEDDENLTPELREELEECRRRREAMEYLDYHQVPIFDISNFQNLKTLEVLGIYGNLKVQAKHFATVLAENRGLTSLAVSLQESVYPGGERLDNPELEHNKFCSRMCSIFGDELK